MIENTELMRKHLLLLVISNSTMDMLLLILRTQKVAATIGIRVV